MREDTRIDAVDVWFKHYLKGGDVEEKRSNLLNNVQKEVINNIVKQLNESHPSFYYLSTIEVAAEIKKYIHQEGTLSREQFDAVESLSRHDIQMLLSLHDH